MGIKFECNSDMKDMLTVGISGLTNNDKAIAVVIANTDSSKKMSVILTKAEAKALAAHILEVAEGI